MAEKSLAEPTRTGKASTAHLPLKVHLLMMVKEMRARRIIDQFMECEHNLVEITVENRKANYVSNMLNKRIGERGLEEKVKAWRKLSRVN